MNWGRNGYYMSECAQKPDVIYNQTEAAEVHASFFNVFNKGKYSLATVKDQKNPQGI
jgi:hypothetical protein